MPAVPPRAGSLPPHQDTARLAAYERRIKDAFDGIVPALREISALQHEADFEGRAQAAARRSLGFELPQDVLDRAWVAGLDMRRLFADVLFRTVERMSHEFFEDDPLGGRDAEATCAFFRDCGYHFVSISPCADGRLAHLVSYVLRLPYGAVRRKSYAGALFDVELGVERWIETELGRFKEGVPNTADEPTRYLKIAVYHYSGSDPHEGCAAHGYDRERAAAAALERLYAFRTAIENRFCCGTSVDLLLLGVDTDTDALRAHVPDGAGTLSLERYVDATEASPNATAAGLEDWIRARAAKAAGGPPPAGMLRLLAHLLRGNREQVEHVRATHGGHYPDIGHQECFIGLGTGFEEVQLRNLTYFAHVSTVEEGANDLDVGVGIFRRLNVARGLPIPIVIRMNYDGRVPGSRERALAHCRRLDAAVRARYPSLVRRGLLHTRLSLRDPMVSGAVEYLDDAAGAEAARP